MCCISLHYSGLSKGPGLLGYRGTPIKSLPSRQTHPRASPRRQPTGWHAKFHLPAPQPACKATAAWVPAMADPTGAAGSAFLLERLISRRPLIDPRGSHLHAVQARLYVEACMSASCHRARLGWQAAACDARPRATVEPREPASHNPRLLTGPKRRGSHGHGHPNMGA